MTDTAELIARLKYEAANCDWVRPVLAGMLRWAADALSSLVRERDKLRHDNEMLTKGGIIEVAVRNFSVADYMQHWETRATAAEAERDEAREAAYDQPHGPTSRMLWSTRYGELLDDYKDERARREAAEANAARMREALVEISSPAHTLNLLWWQIRAREALASLSNTSEGGKGE